MYLHFYHRSSSLCLGALTRSIVVPGALQGHRVLYVEDPHTHFEGAAVLRHKMAKDIWSDLI